MKLPSGFKENIADIFYDKTITVYEIETIKDNYGYTRLSAEESDTTFLGNVRFSDLVRIQEDYGIKESIDIAITTEYSIEAGTIIGYGSQTYKIIKVIPSDSHNLIVANRWESKSTGLISA